MIKTYEIRLVSPMRTVTIDDEVYVSEGNNLWKNKKGTLVLDYDGDITKLAVGDTIQLAVRKTNATGGSSHVMRKKSGSIKKPLFILKVVVRDKGLEVTKDLIGDTLITHSCYYIQVQVP